MALSAIRVIDLTRVLAGPFCTQLLADMGADVIKIESPKNGDPVRKQGVVVNGLSWYFAQFNRNKRSLTLDLYSNEGKEILADLIADADVLVENFRPGVLAKMGFDQNRLEQLNKKLIVASVNGYGSSGPYATRPSFDFIAQAMSGFMSVTGTAQEPLRAGPPISDLIAGLYTAFGILCALIKRGIDGDNQGQQVESSLSNGMISMLAFFSAQYFVSGEAPERTGNNHPIVCPYGLFRAADGDVAIAPSNDEFVKRFLDTIDLSHLLLDERFCNNTMRVKNRLAMNQLINEKISCNPVNFWIEKINAAGVPCGRVMDLPEVFNDPQVIAQEMVLDVEQPGHGQVKMTGFPVKLSESPAKIRRPAPRLGEHDDQILQELGYDEDRISQLRKQSVIREKPSLI